MATLVLEDQAINAPLTQDQLREVSNKQPLYLKVRQPNSSKVMDAYLNTATLQLMYDPPYVDPSISSSNLSVLFRKANVPGEQGAIVWSSYNVIPSATLKVSDQPIKPDIYDVTLKVDNSYSPLFYLYDSETQSYAFFALPEGKNGEQVFLRPFEDENKQKIIRGETAKKGKSAEVYVFEVRKSKKLNPDIVMPDVNIQPAVVVPEIKLTSSVPVADHCHCCQCASL